MTTIDIFEIIVGTILSLGALIAGAGYGYGQFSQGRKKLKKDDIELFNEQLEAFKKIIEAQKVEADNVKKDHIAEMSILREDIKKHTQEIGRLQGINEEKEKKILELTNLLQNRDPALKEFIDLARPVIEQSKPLIEQFKMFLDKEVERRANPEVKNLA